MAEKFYYYPEIFNVADEQAARAIILTDEGPGADTDTRWAHETPYMAELLATHLRPGPDSLIIDYGCGIGRLAKELIGTCGCHVIGVDISADMRRLSVDYVGSPRFAAVSPESLARMVAAGLRADTALCIWVLQHCFAPAQDIARISSALRDGGKFLVVNMPKRAIPVRQAEDFENNSKQYGWGTDDIDVRQLLTAAFAVTAEGGIDMTRIPNPADAGGYWMSLAKTAG